MIFTKKEKKKNGMRLWKKVSAMVAMAAVCMTMAVPAVASAEVDARVGGCAVHNWSVTQVREEVSGTTIHKYDDGRDCTITEIKVIRYQYCNDCGIIQTIDHTYRYEHSICVQ